MNNPDHFNRQWNSTRHTANMAANSLAAKCSGYYRDLILRNTRKFCDQSPPQTMNVMNRLYKQANNLAGMNRSISKAAATAAIHPGVANLIQVAVQEFVFSTTIDRYNEMDSVLLDQRIAKICESVD